MSWFHRVVKVAIAIPILVVWFLTPRVNAQTQAGPSTNSPEAKEASPADGWHVDITPYIWGAAMRGTVGALGHEAGVDASFGDIAKYVNIGAMGTMGVRYGRVLVPVDFVWMRLSDDFSLPFDDPRAESIKVKVSEFFITPKVGYRVADGKKVKVDALFGARIWHLGTTLTLQPTQLATGFSQSTTWTDAVAGGGITFALSRKASLVVAGDAGGGSARSDYQVGGFLGYQISRRWNLLGGYRYLAIDYRPNERKQFVYDLNTPGLIVGATFSIK